MESLYYVKFCVVIFLCWLKIKKKGLLEKICKKLKKKLVEQWKKKLKNRAKKLKKIGRAMDRQSRGWGFESPV